VLAFFLLEVSSLMSEFLLLFLQTQTALRIDIKEPLAKLPIRRFCEKSQKAAIGNFASGS